MPPRNGGKLDKPADARGTLRRILSYILDYRVALLLLLALTFASNVLGLMGPRLASIAIGEADAGMGKVNFDRVWFYASRMLIVYLIAGALNFLVQIAMMHISRLIARNMRRDIFTHLTSLPVSYFDRNQTGDIISRVSYDVDVVTTSLSTDLVHIITSVVTVVGSFIMMAVTSLPLIVCMLVPIPLAVIITRTRARISRPLFRRRSAAYGEMNGYVEEMFSGQKTILAYAHEEDVCREFADINREAADAYYRAQSVAMTAGPLVGFVNNLGLGLIGLVGCIFYLNGIVTLESISGFVLYSRKFAGPINEVANIYNEILSALAAAERIFRFLDEAPEAADAPGAEVLSEVEGSVSLEHVSFGYLPGVIVLKDLSLEAPAGRTVAIVGHTGAGKTTIINLLMRFYDVASGTIRIDGKEIGGITRDSLRRAYAMVLQDTWLFEGTVFDNIAYGKENASMEEVVAAAKAAHIHSTILQLPQGYRTVITDDGGNISKGQKQLLTIARAMLYDARMLILDEATSNVDTRTERQVQAAMARLMQGKTCFVIAHRLSTVQNADRILVLDRGDVIEQGTHAELMARRGAYYALYAAQFE
ncbi:MAG: ABC transporter ATP-binding protein [Lachnospiraceae bacterium]|nr:ABC transporter ATP-binding protein [Lachnospiraceae bacterium]